MHGKGVWYYENGVKGYDGNQKQSKYCICVNLFTKCPLKGEWKDNFSDGHGISFYDNGKKCFEGKHGVFIRKKY